MNNPHVGIRRIPAKEQKTTKRGEENRIIIRDFLKHPTTAIETLPFSKLVKVYYSRKVPTSKKELVFLGLLGKGNGSQLARLYERIKDQSKKSLISDHICMITGFEDGKNVFLMGKKLKNETFMKTGIKSMFDASKKIFDECEDRIGNLARYKLYGDKDGFLEGKLRTCKKQLIFIRDNAGYDRFIFEESLEIIAKIDKLIAEFCIL